MTTLRRAFVGASIVWAMALPLATIAATRPTSQASSAGYAFALMVYAAGSLICHQRPERSFHLLGTQMPVCARCMGIYAGAAAMAVFAALRSAEALRHSSRSDVVSASRRTVARSYVVSAFRRTVVVAQGFSPAAVLVLAALPTAATLIVEWTTGQTPGNWIRAASGLPLGAAVAWMVCSVR